MRIVMLAGSALLGAATAHAASSVTEVRTGSPDRSIERFVCETCGPVKVKVVEEEPEITLKPGEQKIEIRDVDGVKKVFRTEAWFGGSPVVVVSKATAQDVEQIAAKDAAEPTDVAEPVLIDPSQTTSVTANMSGGAGPDVEKAEAKPLDPSKLELRLK